MKLLLYVVVLIILIPYIKASELSRKRVRDFLFSSRERLHLEFNEDSIDIDKTSSESKHEYKKILHNAVTVLTSGNFQFYCLSIACLFFNYNIMHVSTQNLN